MMRSSVLCLVSLCFVLVESDLLRAQYNPPNNGFIGNNPGYGQGYQGPRTDPRLGYCLNNDCFAGQGPHAHMRVFYGGGYGDCCECGGYGGGEYGGSSTMIRITIYPSSTGTPPVVQQGCPYCGNSPGPNNFVPADLRPVNGTGPSTTNPANAVPYSVPTSRASGQNRAYKYKF